MIVGRRYCFALRSGRVWTGTLAIAAGQVIILSGAIELTTLRAKRARALLRSNVAAVCELAQ